MPFLACLVFKKLIFEQSYEGLLRLFSISLQLYPYLKWEDPPQAISSKKTIFFFLLCMAWNIYDDKLVSDVTLRTHRPNK